MNDGFTKTAGVAEGDKKPKRRWPVQLNRGSGPRPGYSSKQAVKAGAVLIAILLLLGATWLFFQRNGLRGGDTTSPAPVEQPDLVLTDAQSLYAQFGPWADSVIIDGVELPNDPDHLVWLGNDGSLQVSQRSVMSEVEWRASRPPFITNLSLSDELVVITINQDATYMFYLGQPFVYASQPETTYMIDPVSGEVMVVPTSTLLTALGQ